MLFDIETLATCDSASVAKIPEMKTNKNIKIVLLDMLLPDVKSGIDIFLMLKNIRKEGVTLSSFNTNFSKLESKPGSLLIHPVFEMSLKGRFINMGKFIDDLDDKKVYKGITKARISYDEKEYPVLTGKFTLEFTARRSGSLEEGK